MIDHYGGCRDGILNFQEGGRSFRVEVREFIAGREGGLIQETLSFYGSNSDNTNALILLV